MTLRLLTSRQTADPRRVVLVHDWLTGMRGGEKCLEPACERWPDATLLTLLHRRGSVSPTISRLGPKASYLNRFPGVHQYYRYLLPLMPTAARWRIPACDLVLSFSHCVAKAATPPPNTPHICYCFTPMRYAWHMRESYFARGRWGRWKHHALDWFLSRLRDWDRATSHRVTHFVAISETIRQRIRECYDRDSVVIYPPVDTDFYTPSGEPREDFYLVHSALAPYKRFDLAIAACEQLGRRLVVIGTGQEAKRLKALAGSRVQFLGWQPDEVVRDYLRRCRALLYPGEEDFGIVPVEAQACGTPVIALGRGGATETVRPLGAVSRPTGVWFTEQTVDSVIDGLVRFEREADTMDPADARQNALPYRRQRYEAELFHYIESVLSGSSRSTSQAA